MLMIYAIGLVIQQQDVSTYSFLQYGALGLLAAVLVAVGWYFRRIIDSQTAATATINSLIVEQLTAQRAEASADKVQQAKTTDFVQRMAEAAIAEKEGQLESFRKMVELVVSAQHASAKAIEEHTDTLKEQGLLLAKLCASIESRAAADNDRFSRLLENQSRLLSGMPPK